MRIAVASDKDENIFPRFGKADFFKIYQVNDNEIEWGRLISFANLDEHEERARYLRALKVEKLICGNICENAQDAVRNEGLAIYGGVSGSADDAVGALLAGSLEYDEHPAGCEDCE